jgi:hypothetical protein
LEVPRYTNLHVFKCVVIYGIHGSILSVAVIPGRVKPKIIELLFADSPLNIL